MARAGRSAAPAGADADQTGPGRPAAGRLAEWLPLGLIVLAVWLSFQILQMAVTQRVPPGLAVRINPGSVRALSRAAEAEYADGRFDSAEALARETLKKAPFDARALRVAGLTADKRGEAAAANEMVTLAGNWSLRDDPAHAWLVLYRLRQGDVPGAYAHADTLMRRGKQQQAFFDLFATAARDEPRTRPVLAALLAARPPWERAFFTELYKTRDGTRLAATLAIDLERAGKPIDGPELTRLYQAILRRADAATAFEVRKVLGRPALPADRLLENGDFSQDLQSPPFGWQFRPAPGLLAEIAADPTHADNRALWASYNGIGQRIIISQMVAAPSGRLTLSGRLIEESTHASDRIAWQVQCLQGGGRHAFGPLQIAPSSTSPWQNFSTSVTLPTAGCGTFQLELANQAAAGRTSASIWLDDLRLTPSDQP